MFNRKIIDYLVKWKDKKGRKPLILRGARQVGKTSAILMFARQYFDNVIYLNMEKVEHQRLFRGEVSLEDFEKIIKIEFHQDIIPRKTIVFIDEIQNSVGLIKLLRFFYEEKPELHIISAGSLLQAKIEREGLSLPVGRIENAYIYPLDFFEYLEAKGEMGLLSYLNNISIEEHIPQGIHEKALNLFYEYAMIGGMPEVVKTYLGGRNIEHINNIYSSLLTGYAEDVYKYSSLANAKYLTFVIETAPLYAGTNISYEKFGSSNFRSREMNRAFDLLEKIMLVYQVKATKSIDMPLVPQRKRPKKLLFLDVGLVNYQMGIQEKFLTLKDLNDFYRGRIAEQIVGQNLLSQYINHPAQMYYWAKEKPKGRAEVDFCFTKGGVITGVEVKSGSSNRLKSLISFGDLTKNSHLVRVYNGILKKEDIKINSNEIPLISLPFYLIPRISDI